MALSEKTAKHAWSKFQHATLEIGWKTRPFLSASVRISPLGLLSVAALVSSILLSSAVIVRAASDRIVIP
jgi:hypothetical protein